ncbi:MAG: MoaD family protein [Candidatus Freyarchaeota archaeon]|nr:MoaD family protein [Candidatus Jordarchaeia archaeon]
MGVHVMVKVKVKFFASLRDKYKVREVEVDCDGGLESLMHSLDSKVKGVRRDLFDDEKRTVKDNVLFLLNGVNVKTMKEPIRFKDGDIVSIFPPIAGG